MFWRSTGDEVRSFGMGRLRDEVVTHAPALALGAGLAGGDEGAQVLADGGGIKAVGGLGLAVGEAAAFAQEEEETPGR